MKLTVQTDIIATPEKIWEYLLSDEYVRALEENLEGVERIEEVERREEGEVLVRRMRYSAPTASKIPSFLSRYADKAPAHVHWEQRERWDLAMHAMSYQIVAEIKPEWQRYYSASGGLKLKPLSEAMCRLDTSLQFEVNVFGLKKLIERALKEETTRILQRQSALVADHFGPPPEELMQP